MVGNRSSAAFRCSALLPHSKYGKQYKTNDVERLPEQTRGIIGNIRLTLLPVQLVIAIIVDVSDPRITIIRTQTWNVWKKAERKHVQFFNGCRTDTI